MKRPTITRLALMCAAALAASAACADPPAPAHPGMMHPGMMHGGMMHGGMMHDGMMCGWPHTGSADQDFALRMRHHDAMGIAMARDELAHGTDAQMRARAQQVIDAQTPEVAQLEAWLTGQHVDYAMPPAHGDWRAHFDAMDLDHDGRIEAGEVAATDPWHAHFAAADADHDGSVSRAEMEAWRPPMRPWARFEDVDTDHDGSVSRAELEAYRPMHGGLRFEAMDANHDGMLDSTEVAVGSPWYPNFAAADADHDGKVTRAEADAWHAAHGPMMDHDHDHDGDMDDADCGHGMGHDGDAHSAPMPPDFAGLDRNGDGYLTLAELPQSYWARDHFTAIDANGDGQVSRAEFDAHHAMMESMRH